MKKTGIFVMAIVLLCSMEVSAQSVVSENVFKDITTLSKVRSSRFAAPSPAGKFRKAGKPVAFYIGDSTMRTNSNGQGWNGQWGFGLFAQEWFDENELVVENHGWGGTTSETYYTGKWADVKKGIKAGDFVLIDFGHNDKSATTFETYIKKYIDEVQALGATPILCSRTPRCSSGSPSADNTYRPRGMAIAKEKGVAYVDLQAKAMPMYTAFGKWKTTQFYQDGKLHTSLLGAWHNAYCHALAIAEDKDNPLYPYLKDTTMPKMDIEREAGKPYIFNIGDDKTSARDFFRSGRWMLLYNTLEEGDSVFLAFGQNELKSQTASGELGCIQSADESNEVKQMSSTSRYETVYSYGWYIHYFLNDIKEKGAIGVLVNDEASTPDKVKQWNTTLATRHGVKLLTINTAGMAETQFDGKHAGTSQRYNLAGQPVDENYRGVVIVDGQKMIVR